MRWLAIAAIVAGLGASRNAAADDEEPKPDDKKQIAMRLFYEGRILYDQGKYLEACILFEKSDQFDTLVGTRLNLAECAEREGKPRAAWLLWIDAAEQFEAASDNRAKFARQRADALAPKLATVVLRVARPKRKGLEITIAGRAVKPAAEIVERLDKSRIVIAASAPNRVPFSTTVSVAIGDEIEVDVPALRRVAGVKEDPEDRPRSNPWFRAAIVGGVFTIGTVVVVAASASRVNDLEDQAFEASVAGDELEVQRITVIGERWATISWIAALATSVGLVATTVFLVKGVRLRNRREAATAVRLSPIVAPRVAGVQLDLRW